MSPKQALPRKTVPGQQFLGGGIPGSSSATRYPVRGVVGRSLSRLARHVAIALADVEALRRSDE